MNFSQRHGIKPIRKILQSNSIDDSTKTKLWNSIHVWFYEFFMDGDKDLAEDIFIDIHCNFFSKKINDFKNVNTSFYIDIQNWFFLNAEWNEIYDFIEKISSFCTYFNSKYPHAEKNELVEEMNLILKYEFSAYRILNNQVVPISSDIEIESLIEATNDNSFKEVNTHLNSAIDYFSNREKPDFRNSIKESISAVESICKIITKENTLGKALNNLQKSGIRINPSLKSAFDKLYSYTNDSKTGIRHAFSDDSYVPDFDEAKFMLVSCSSFINYLKSKMVQF